MQVFSPVGHNLMVVMMSSTSCSTDEKEEDTERLFGGEKEAEIARECVWCSLLAFNSADLAR